MEEGDQWSDSGGVEIVDEFEVEVESFLVYRIVASAQGDYPGP